MAVYTIVFLDGCEVTVEAVCFSVAKVMAAHERVQSGATMHTQLVSDDKESSAATKKIRNN